jgi:ketosteroid isomerase-like protein
MKRLLVTAGIVLLTAGGAIAEQAGKPGAARQDDAAVTKALLALEDQWGAAAKASNGDALAPLLADSFVALDTDGTLHSKAEVIARVKKAKWVTNELGDMKVTVHGDSAIVTGTWTGNGTDGTGKTVNARERWVDTWVKTADGKWVCVASASAPMK